MADPTVAAQLKAARATFKLTQAEVGRMLGVSADMVSKIERGKTPGTRWASAVGQLGSRGVVVTPPARRAQRVRAPGGRTVQAPEAPPALNRAGGRYRYGVQRGVTGAGGRSTTVDAPGRGMGRERARQTLAADLRAHARNARADMRVKVQVTTREGRVYTIGTKGGYRPGTLLQGWSDEGEDPYAWIADTLDGMGYDVSAGQIASVTLLYV